MARRPDYRGGKRNLVETESNPIFLFFIPSAPALQRGAATESRLRLPGAAKARRTGCVEVRGRSVRHNASSLRLLPGQRPSRKPANCRSGPPDRRGTTQRTISVASVPDRNRRAVVGRTSSWALFRSAHCGSPRAERPRQRVKRSQRVGRDQETRSSLSVPRGLLKQGRVCVAAQQGPFMQAPFLTSSTCGTGRSPTEQHTTEPCQTERKRPRSGLLGIIGIPVGGVRGGVVPVEMAWA